MFTQTLLGKEFKFRDLTWEEEALSISPLEVLVLSLDKVSGKNFSELRKRKLLESLGERVMSNLWILWQNSQREGGRWSTDLPYSPPPPSKLNIQIIDLNLEPNDESP